MLVGLENKVPTLPSFLYLHLFYLSIYVKNIYAMIFVCSYPDHLRLISETTNSSQAKLMFTKAWNFNLAFMANKEQRSVSRRLKIQSNYFMNKQMSLVISALKKDNVGIKTFSYTDLGNQSSPKNSFSKDLTSRMPLHLPFLSLNLRCKLEGADLYCLQFHVPDFVIVQVL